MVVRVVTPCGRLVAGSVSEERTASIFGAEVRKYRHSVAILVRSSMFYPSRLVSVTSELSGVRDFCVGGIMAM